MELKEKMLTALSIAKGHELLWNPAVCTIEEKSSLPWAWKTIKSKI